MIGDIIKIILFITFLLCFIGAFSGDDTIKINLY